MQYNRIETGKSDPAMNILQCIANVLEINVLEFFEAKNNGTKVHTAIEPLLQKVRLLEELDELQKNYLQYDRHCHRQQTPKEALNNPMSITI